jgi:CopG family nickel-responsive transcriptional regulator
MSISRFSVSLESNLLEALDSYVAANHFPNRSQAIRQLIERDLVEKKWQCNSIVAGAIILVYDPARRGLLPQLAECRQAYREEILALQQFPLSAGLCFEIVAVRGPSYRLTELADRLIGTKGIAHGKLVMTKSDNHTNPNSP